MAAAKTGDLSKVVLGLMVATTLAWMLVICMPGTALSSTEEESHHEGEHEDPVAPKKGGPPRKKQLAYAKYKRYLERVCEYAALDGRGVDLLNIAEKAAARDEACRACRPLWQPLVTACKKFARTSKPSRTTGIRRKPALEEGEGEQIPPTATAVPEPVKRFDPGTELLNEVSTITILLAEDVSQAEETALAVRRIVDLMRAVDGSSRNYFTTLAAYFEAPFLDLLAPKPSRKPSEQESTGGFRSAPAEDAGSMFEF